MHRALYRTYRPATFDEVAGQDHITSVLRYEVSAGKTSHAYLFCGSRGTGKTTCAKIMAKAVNCLSPVNGNPCLKCANCRAVENGETTDVLEMDAASNTGVDYIRDIKDAVMYVPSMLKNRVYIIDEVHMLTDSAFNALLKTLEEPPSNVVFILATTEPQKIPQTILSRCQRFEFRRIPAGVIAQRLSEIAAKEEISLDSDAAYLIARSAQGGMRDAISLLELCSAGGEAVTAEKVLELSGSSGRGTVERAVEAILQKDCASLFSIAAELYASSVDPAVFWQDLIAFYRDMIVCKTVKNMPSEELRTSVLDLTEGEFERLSHFAGRFNYETLIYHFGILDNTYASAFVRGGATSRIAVEMALARMTVESANASPEALLVRIAALEERVAKLRYERSALPAYAAAKENKPETASVPDAGETGLSRSAPAPEERKESAVGGNPPPAAPAIEAEGDLPGVFVGFEEVLHDYLQKEPSMAPWFADREPETLKNGDLRVFVVAPIGVRMLEDSKAGETIGEIIFRKSGVRRRVRFDAEKEQPLQEESDQIGFDLFS